jgi:hypothetical protein
MSLRQQQSEFVRAVGLLITYAYYLGFEVTFGDTYPGKYKHRESSWHGKGLAIDLNLFKDDKYLRACKDHEPLGIFWESLGGTWGGRFANKDGNHYSWNEVR